MSDITLAQLQNRHEWRFDSTKYMYTANLKYFSVIQCVVSCSTMLYYVATRAL